MAEIISFKAAKNKRHAGNTLCKEGHHKWAIDQEKQFDSRSGKLVTIYRCSRCQKQKTKLL